MTDKQKRRIRKSLKKRQKEQLARSWRNIFVKSGYLKEVKS